MQIVVNFTADVRDVWDAALLQQLYNFHLVSQKIKQLFGGIHEVDAIILAYSYCFFIDEPHHQNRIWVLGLHVLNYFAVIQYDTLTACVDCQQAFVVWLDARRNGKEGKLAEERVIAC